MGCGAAGTVCSKPLGMWHGGCELALLSCCWPSELPVWPAPCCVAVRLDPCASLWGARFQARVLRPHPPKVQRKSAHMQQSPRPETQSLCCQGLPPHVSSVESPLRGVTLGVLDAGWLMPVLLSGLACRHFPMWASSSKWTWLFGGHTPQHNGKGWMLPG